MLVRLKRRRLDYCRTRRAALVVSSYALLACGAHCDDVDARGVQIELLQTTFELNQPSFGGADFEVPSSYAESLVADATVRQSLIAEATARLRAAEAAAHVRASAQKLASAISNAPAASLQKSSEMLRVASQTASDGAFWSQATPDSSAHDAASVLAVGADAQEGANGSTVSVLLVPAIGCFCCLCCCFFAFFYEDLSDSSIEQKKKVPFSADSKARTLRSPLTSNAQAIPAPQPSASVLPTPLGTMPLPPPVSPPPSSVAPPQRSLARTVGSGPVNKAPPLGSVLRLQKGSAHFSIATSELLELNAGRGGAELLSAHLAGFPLLHLNMVRSRTGRSLEISGSPDAPPEVSVSPVPDPWVEKAAVVLENGKPFGTFARINYQDSVGFRVLHQASCVLEIRQPEGNPASRRAAGLVILEAYHGEGSGVLAAKASLGASPQGPPALLIDVEADTEVTLAIAALVSAIVATPELLGEVERWRGSIGGRVS